MIPLEDARRFVLDRVAPRAAALVPAAEAAGCVLARAVIAAEPVPPFANTAMDGYAVRADDTQGARPGSPIELPVVAEVAAGHPAAGPLQPGQAMRIFTGAPVPDGADAVVVVERTRRLDGGAAVAIEEHVEPGRHLRHPGEDVRAGQEVFEPGEVLGAGHLGVLASIGATEVLVHRPPTVGVLSTGDELVEAGTPLGPGQIRDSNRRALLARLRGDGFGVVDLGIVRDDEEALVAAIDDAAARCDALLTSGGVSMGDTDLVKVVLDRMGEMRWMQIAIRPAKPFAFGLVGAARLPVFGLPGNPVSSLVSYELLARPALRRIGGHRDPVRPAVRAVADEPLPRRPDGKVHLARVTVRVDGDGVLRVRSAGGQGSHQLAALARAGALAVLPDGDGVAAGDPVRVLLLDPL